MSEDGADPRRDRTTQPGTPGEGPADDDLASFLGRLVTSQADPAVTGEPPEDGSEASGPG